MAPSAPLQMVGPVCVANVRDGTAGSDRFTVPETVPMQPLRVTEKFVYAPADSPLSVKALADTFTRAESAVPSLVNLRV